jgi:hypothetical protein
MRVAAYVRVSTPGQVKLQTIDQQLETIHRYVWDKEAGSCQKRTSFATTATAERVWIGQHWIFYATRRGSGSLTP